MLVEKIRKVTLTNGLVRMEAVTFGPDGEEVPAGVLHLPGNQAGQVVQALSNAVQQLSRGGGDAEAGEPQGTGAQTVTIGACPVHFRRNDDGDGRPVILLHGAKFSAATWQELGTIDVLAERGHRVWAMDLPGYGESASCEENPLRVIASFMRTFDQLPVLVGPSMSGKVALDLALQAPHLVGGLVLVAPVKVPQVADRLGEIEAPTLVVWGDRDQVADPKHAETLRTGLQDARVETMEGGNHPCYLDDPERWHAVLTGFLTERFGQSG